MTSAQLVRYIYRWLEWTNMRDGQSLTFDQAWRLGMAELNFTVGGRA